jgi:hypothetical protein
MTTQTQLDDFKPSPMQKRLYGGIFLIALGLFLTVAQFIQAQWMGMLIMPGLSLMFITWGLISRNSGLFVPGGILGGIGLGTYLVSGPYMDVVETHKGGVFLLAFAAGWALITLLSLIVGKRQLWPLIPGTILATIGGLLLAGTGGAQILEWVSRLWPLALIVAGAVALLRRKA